ncbi:MAG: phosphomevalonate kinase [Candidatus Aenigmarchaeota archaeon]|nr:phosphomevalonate kinase [Candidatus Aenigmarchaeota archaeon]
MPIHYSAPGKLFISGEWSILEVGNYGLVAAVNNRVHVSVEALSGYDGISVTAEEFKIHDARAKILSSKLNFMNLDEKSKETLKLLSTSLETAIKFAEEKGHKFKPFKIATSSKDTQLEADGGLKKVGFGSSAAVVVAATAAVLDFLGYVPTKEEVYKLSTISHYFAQGKVGSAFDVAASTYGGLFVYSRFDPEWLIKKVEAEEKLSVIVSENWPGFYIEELEVPNDFLLLVGWTGESASTSSMIKQMNEFKKNNPETYFKHCNEIAKTAKDAINAFKKKDYNNFYLHLLENENLLAELGKASGVNIETPQLRTLSDIAADCGAAGKLSGAGGGDCGIAVCFDRQIAEDIVAKWRAAGLYPLDVTIDKDGVRKES